MLIDVLSGTPWWVYLILVYLLNTGIKALKPQTIPLKKLFILPTVFFVWGIYSLVTKSIDPRIDTMCWILMLSIGSVWGWKVVHRVVVKSDETGPVAMTEGSWLTLLLGLSIFCVKYLFGYFYATDPLLRESHLFVLADLVISGFLTGMLVGRVLHYLYKWYRHSQK